MLGDFISQKTAETGGDVREFPGVARRDRFPTEEIFKQGEKSVGNLELISCGFDMFGEPDHRADQFPALPQAERLAVRVN